MKRLMIEYDADGAHHVGYSNVPDTGFNVTGLAAYLLDEKRFRNVSIYYAKSGAELNVDAEFFKNKEDMEYLVIESLRDLRYYGHDYDNLRRAFCKMGPNYQDLLARPKRHGRMI